MVQKIVSVAEFNEKYMALNKAELSPREKKKMRGVWRMQRLFILQWNIRSSFSKAVRADIRANYLEDARRQRYFTQGFVRRLLAGSGKLSVIYYGAALVQKRQDIIDRAFAQCEDKSALKAEGKLKPTF